MHVEAIMMPDGSWVCRQAHCRPALGTRRLELELHRLEPQELHRLEPQELHRLEPQELHKLEPEPVPRRPAQVWRMQAVHRLEPQELHKLEPQELHKQGRPQVLHRPGLQGFRRREGRQMWEGAGSLRSNSIKSKYAD